jgi:DNA-binding GntR family transcriptional regulator
MKDSPIKMLPPKSITDQIYDFIMARIQFGDIEDGERLIETQVAKSLNTSRTPVRESFRRLEQDGVVERIPQGGVRVTPRRPVTIKEISKIRSLLESYAIERACELINERQIEKLDGIKNEAKKIINSSAIEKEEKVRRLFECNTSFHDIIDQASGSPYLAKVINNLRVMVLRQRAIGIREEGSWRDVWEEHDKLIFFLKMRDKEAASNFMKMHIEKAASHAVAALGKL